MTDRPNILIIVVDSLRADRASCYGYERETTPNIDRLAEEGCLFETAISAAPFSPASYASIFSNLYPHQHGVNGDTVRVWPDHWPRLSEHLQACGYETFCISSNSFVSQETNGARGFDSFTYARDDTWWTRQQLRILRRVRRYFGDRMAHRLTSNALHCIGKGNSLRMIHEAAVLVDKATKPVFGFLILMDPHTPYNRDRVEPDCDLAATRRFFRRHNSKTMWAELMADHAGLSVEELTVVRDLYDSETRYADACVGELIRFLRLSGRLDDTVLVVTADHGEAFGENGVWGHGFNLCDCLTRVPLIARCPRYWSPGRRSNALVQLHDLHELCLGVADTGTPDLARYPRCLTQADDPTWTGRTHAFSEFPYQSKTLAFMKQRNANFESGNWGAGMWAVRTPEWHYIEYENGACELYDLGADPYETRSVHESRTDHRDRLREVLAAHKADRPHEPATAVATDDVEEVVLERLRSLGYIE